MNYPSSFATIAVLLLSFTSPAHAQVTMPSDPNPAARTATPLTVLVRDAQRPPKPTPEETGETLPASPAIEKAVDWRDPVTNHSYLFVPKKRTWARTNLACRNRGWSVFNPKYLSADEWNRFMASPVIAAITWTTRFPDEPGEVREAAVWSSTSYSDSGFADANLLKLRWLKVEGKTRATIEQSSTGNVDEGMQLSTICMYRGEHWYRCGAVQTCTHYEMSFGPTYYSVPFTSRQQTIEESGPTEQSAWEWIRRTGTYSTKGDSGPRVECKVDEKTLHCDRER